MAKITSSPLTFIDQTDSRKFEVHISSNLPQVQTYNQNTKAYSPDWSNTALNLQASIYLDSTDITANIADSDVEWYKNTISTATKISSGKTLTINTNVLSTEPIITYICQAKYQNLTTGTRIDFTRIDSGINGSAGASAPAVQAQYSVDGSAWTATLNAASHKYVRYSYDGGKTWTTAIKMVGEDGTSVAIKGTATSVTSVSGTNYYTVTYGGASITTATLGDSYLYSGDLYVCSELRDGADYFVNVGKIQGPAGNDGESSYVFIRYATDANGTGMSTSPSGKTYIGVYTSNINTPPTTASVYTWSKFVGDSAKSIILSGDSQVFKVSKSSAYTPTTIKVTAQTINTSVTTWTYNTNNGQGFVSVAPTGVTRSGNIVTITGSTLATDSVVIKASDGTVEDIFTVYKAFDGANGTQGATGQSASMAFLTNENVTLGANANGIITSATITTNVVAYNGTTKTTPTIGTISGLPTGMTAKIGAATNSEVPIVFTITNSNLGSTSNNNGSITIPVNGPVYTNLILTWSKVNSGVKGDKGDQGVSIKSTTVTYGVSDSASTLPVDTAWQSTIPTVAEGKYLWTRTIIDYTDDTVADTVTYTYAKQGIKGDTGSNGSSVTVLSVQYQEGTSATTAPTGTWSNTVVSVAEGKYLWTKTAFSDGKIAYGVAKQGVSGKDGVGINSTTVNYGSSDSSTVKPTVWYPDIPAVEEGKYLWTRTITDYTDQSKADTVTYIYAKQGAKGDTGSSGSSVTVSSIQYQASTSATTAPTGTWSNSVVTVAEGSYLWTKTTFSDGKVAYGVAKQGAKGSAGTPASLVDITPSALYFKSTTGKDGTFTPEFIYLYPRFQSATYSNWQYSTDGGITWVAASGANGVSIGTYNSVASTLRISRASTLYTDNITSISFRCNSTTSGVYDTVSIAKIYDVVDLDIGGRNLLTNSGYMKTLDGWVNYAANSMVQDLKLETNSVYGSVLTVTGTADTSRLKVGKYIPYLQKANRTLTFSMVYSASVDPNTVTMGGKYSASDSTGEYNAFNGGTAKRVDLGNGFTYMECPVNLTYTADTRSFFVYIYPKIQTVKIVWCKLEDGNKATDWTPAPEDVDTNITKVDTRLTNSLAEVKTTTDSITSRVSATETSIKTTNNNVTSLTTRVSATEQKITPTAIVSTVRQSTDYVNDLGKKVGTSEIISKINQTAESVTISANKIGLLGATNIPDLTADKIKGGTLTLGGSNATTQSGQLLVKNASNVDMLKLNKDGIVVKSGHLAVAEDFANSTYDWSTNTWTTTTNTRQLDLGYDYIRMGVYSPSGYSNYMRLLDDGLYFQGNAQGIGSWGSFIGHDSYGDFVIQDTVRGYIVFKGPDDDTEIANISGSGLSVSGVYSNTIASSANVHIDSSGQFYRSTSSSQRYKTDIQNIQSEDLKPEKLYDLPVREFKYKDGYLSEEDRCIDTFVPGFIAEEVAEVYPIACEYDGDKPENWNIRFIVPAMLKLIQDQKKEIDALKQKLTT